jgi:hypothetical protein
VSPARDGCVVVFDEECEGQDPETLARLGARLSKSLACTVLAVLNHDDDILLYRLYSNGTLVDEYNSAPNYFDTDAEPSEPEGGNARVLCDAFGVTSYDTVEAILRKGALTDDGYIFAVDRHADLAGALGIPSFVVGTGFTYILNGELPEGLELETLTRLS